MARQTNDLKVINTASLHSSERWCKCRNDEKIMKNVLYFLIATTILSGCDNPIDQSNSYDYSIEQKTGCFCPLGGIWVKLFVRVDTIADAINLSDNSRLAYEERRSYKSIKGLFDVTSRIDTAKYDVRIIIDSMYNYPSYIFFNPKPIVHGDTVLITADAQMSYTTRNYVKLK